MNKIDVIIEVSARHIHLSRRDFESLFGDDAGYEIVKKLSQKGEFATDKKVKVIGPDGETFVRFLGPFRETTQVELSITDCLGLGITAPLEIDTSDKATEVKLSGECGEITRSSAIVARRHLHCNPKEARGYQLLDGQDITISVKTDRGEILFRNVVVRIRDNYRLRVHLDTDEGNAAGITGVTKGELII